MWSGNPNLKIPLSTHPESSGSTSHITHQVSFRNPHPSEPIWFMDFVEIVGCRGNLWVIYPNLSTTTLTSVSPNGYGIHLCWIYQFGGASLTDGEIVDEWNRFFDEYGCRFPEFEEEWLKLHTPNEEVEVMEDPTIPPDFFDSPFFRRKPIDVSGLG
jgi:hypothetical protein